MKFREKANEYLARCEQLDILIKKEKEAGNYHEQIRIARDSTGHSYETIFGRFLDSAVTSVEVEDPYIRQENMVVLCYILLTYRSLFQDPDTDLIWIQSGHWIRIRDPDPDSRGQN